MDLRFKDWGRVCFVGPLQGEALEMLCDSPDARAMLEWCDEQTGRRCTLLMAKVCLELLGYTRREHPEREPFLARSWN